MPPQPNSDNPDLEARVVDLSSPTLVIQPPYSVRFKSRVVELAPGGSVGLHVTHHREEIVVVLAGEGELLLPKAGGTGGTSEAGEAGLGQEAGAARGASGASGATGGKEAGGAVGKAGGGRVLALSAGRAAYVPPETPHDIRNTGDAPLRYIYIVTLLD